MRRERSSAPTFRVTDACDLLAPTFFSLLGRASLAPFPGYFPASALGALKRAIAHGERSPRHWIASTRTKWIEVDESVAATMASFNTREALEAIGLLAPRVEP